MKTFLVLNSGRPRPQLAFTLTEVMAVATLFTLLLAALFSSHLFGMRMYRVSEAKLSATAQGRKALNQVRDEIRSGKMLMVGNGNSSTFTPIAAGSNQIGNALQVYATTNTNSFVRFYLDAGEKRLKRYTKSTGEVRAVANYITNKMVFRAEDFRGNVLTNSQNNRVIKMTLEFYQWEFPVAKVGHGGMFDYYRLQTRITRRAIE